MRENWLPKRLLVCAMANGSRAVGGQKYRWNDAVMRDLKQCGLADNWRAIAQNRTLWRRVIKHNVKQLNERAEEEEKQKKDVRKRLREERVVNAEEALHCDVPGCVFVAVNKGGLVNHKRQKHAQLQPVQSQFCSKPFQQQGLHNHQHFYPDRPRGT